MRSGITGLRRLIRQSPHLSPATAQMGDLKQYVYVPSGQRAAHVQHSDFIRPNLEDAASSNCGTALGEMRVIGAREEVITQDSELG